MLELCFVPTLLHSDQISLDDTEDRCKRLTRHSARESRWPAHKILVHLDTIDEGIQCEVARTGTIEETVNDVAKVMSFRLPHEKVPACLVRQVNEPPLLFQIIDACLSNTQCSGALNPKWAFIKTPYEHVLCGNSFLHRFKKQLTRLFILSSCLLKKPASQTCRVAASDPLLLCIDG